MGYEQVLLQAGATVNERFKAGEFVQQRQLRNHGLLHGGDDQFVQPVGFKYSSFRSLAEQGSDGIYANLNSLFDEPFEPVNTFCGRYGNMKVKIPLRYGLSM